MSILSPRLRLTLAAAGSVLAAALLGGCPWGP